MQRKCCNDNISQRRMSGVERMGTPLNQNYKHSEKCTNVITENDLSQDVTTHKSSDLKSYEELDLSDNSVIVADVELSDDALIEPNVDTKTFIADTDNSTVHVITSVHVTSLSNEQDENFLDLKGDFEIVEPFENSNENDTLSNNLYNTIITGEESHALYSRDTIECGSLDSSECGVNDIKRKGRSRKEREESKKLRNSGQSYITEKGKEIPRRELRPLSACRMKCVERLSQVERQQCFNEYWALGSRDLRTNYVANLINISPKKTQKTNSKTNNRDCFCKYSLIFDNKEKQTCKECFCKTLGETKGFINIVIEKKKQYPSGIIPADTRGHPPSINKKSRDDTISAKDQISFF